MSLASYKKASTEKLTKALAATQTKFKADERYWQLTVDKAGNGFAIIRFLDRPLADGDDATAFVQVYTHNFQGPGGWYIENSLTSIDQQDPVSEYNSKLWATGIEANKTIARNQKRKLTYISNVLVIKDPGKPDNEGKVFLFKYGKKIFDKVYEMQHPRDGELDMNGNQKQPVNVFDLWTGSNFSLTARKVDDYRNYDSSLFNPIGSPIAKTDEAIEKIITSAYSLKDEVKFKSYDDLKKKLDRVLAFNKDAPATNSAEKAKLQSEVPSAVSAAIAEATAVVPDVTSDSTSEDPDMDFFREMAKG